MNRAELEAYILETYHVQPDYPWKTHPNYAVFRHAHHRKWFAVILDVPRNKLGLPGDDTLCVVNLKCDPLLVGSLQETPGCFPAYHMSKEHWITVALDGGVPEDKLKTLLDMSFDATASKKRP